MPIYGEEILKIGLDKNTIGGSFLKRIEKNQAIKNFFSVWQKWIVARKNGKLPNAKITHEKDRLILTSALGKEESVTLTLHALSNDSYFTRQTLAYHHSSTGAGLKLELFTTECRNPAMH